MKEVGGKRRGLSKGVCAERRSWAVGPELGVRWQQLNGAQKLRRKCRERRGGGWGGGGGGCQRRNRDEDGGEGCSGTKGKKEVLQRPREDETGTAATVLSQHIALSAYPIVSQSSLYSVLHKYTLW
jgi:hypothetical protein